MYAAAQKPAAHPVYHANWVVLSIVLFTLVTRLFGVNNRFP
jgi:hypothetical protein